MLTHRERILAVLERRSPDRIPWIPRLDLWYRARLAEGTMPERYRGMSLREIERAMGLPNPARGARVHCERLEGIEVTTSQRGGESCREYRTPVGTVRERRVRSAELVGYAAGGLVTERLIATEDDLTVWRYIAEHTSYELCYEEYAAFDADVGEEGLPMVFAGDVPFHRFAMGLAGYEGAYYLLHDHTRAVEELLSVMEQVERERLWPILADSPGVLIRHGANLSSQMTPPHLYERYIKPYYTDLSALLSISE